MSNFMFITKAQFYFEERLINPVALLRIAGWTLLFFWLISSIIAHFSRYEGEFQKFFAPDKVLCVALEKGGFLNSVPPKKTIEFRIAWIGGSDLIIKNNDKRNKLVFIPDMIQQKLQLPNNMHPSILLYCVTASKIYDIYEALLHAVEQKPDLIIMSVNPVWVYCNKSIVYRYNLSKHSFASQMREWNSILLTFAITDPLQVILLGISSYIPAVDDHYSFIRNIAKDYYKNYFLKTKIAEEQNPEGLISNFVNGQADQSRNYGEPLAFWLAAEQDKKYIDVERWQEGCLTYYFDNSDDSMNTLILKWALNILSKHNVPSLLYIPPINPEAFNNDIVSQRILQIDNSLRKLINIANNENIRYWNVNPIHGLTKECFRRSGDYLHLSQPEPFITILLHKIHDMSERTIEYNKEKRK